MPTLTFTGLLVVGVVAVAVPLLLELVPSLPLPSLVLEIVGGIVVGPAVLGWVHVDAPVQVVSDLGLGMLLFMAGFEIDPQRLRGRLMSLSVAGYAGSVALGILAGYLLFAGSLVLTPILIAIPLMSTSLGALIPLLKDAGQTDTDFGQLVITAGTIAEFVPVVLLSLLFSLTSESPAGELLLLGGFGLVVAAAAVALTRAVRADWLTAVLRRLDDTSSQLRVRLAIVLALAFAVAAEQFGLAMILGAFMAGVILRVLGQYEPDVQPVFRIKLESIAFGFLVPVFFVATGVELDIGALVNPGTMAKVPVFLAAMLLVRGLPALAYRTLLPQRLVLSAGLLQATTLTMPIVVVQLGIELGRLTSGTGAALLTASLLSVVLFPRLGLSLLRAPRADAVPA
ncbi:MAG TPA: cation:proton antiporter [Segeticoccus sp.]|nr:cation:proton antiporter [Segeticoccus sp.]